MITVSSIIHYPAVDNAVINFCGYQTLMCHSSVTTHTPAAADAVVISIRAASPVVAYLHNPPTQRTCLLMHVTSS